jgi:hypothetical protein
MMSLEKVFIKKIDKINESNLKKPGEINKEEKKLTRTKSLSIIVNDFDFDYSERSPSSYSLISVSPSFKEFPLYEGFFFL